MIIEDTGESRCSYYKGHLAVYLLLCVVMVIVNWLRLSDAYMRQ